MQAALNPSPLTGGLGVWNERTLFGVLAQPLTSSVTLGKLLILSDLQFLISKMKRIIPPSSGGFEKQMKLLLQVLISPCYCVGALSPASSFSPSRSVPEYAHLGQSLNFAFLPLCFPS